MPSIICASSSDEHTAASAMPDLAIRIALLGHDAGAEHNLKRALFASIKRWQITCYLQPSDAFEALSLSPPQALLIEMRRSGTWTFRHLHKVKSLCPETAIVVFADVSTSDEILRAHAAGALGHVLMPSSAPMVLHALSQAIEGWPFLCPETIRVLFASLQKQERPTQAVGLTPREAEILRLLPENNSDKAIAKALQISPATVHAHLDSIYKKLRVNTRARAIRKWLAQTARPRHYKQKTV